MFKNAMTGELPCWKCKKLIGRSNFCPILADFMTAMPAGIQGEAKKHLSGLIFACDAMEAK